MSAAEAEIIVPSAALSLPLREVTLREKSLVDHYLRVKIKWKAAKLAGYSGNMQVLCTTAIDVLKKPEVAAYYQTRLKELHISTEELLAEVAEVVRTPLDRKTQKKTGVRVADKLKAGEMVGKWLGLEKTDAELSFSQADIDRLGESLLRVMMEAAERKRIESSPVIDITPNSE